MQPVAGSVLSGCVTSVVFDMLILASLIFGCLVHSLFVSLLWAIIETRKKPTESEIWLKEVGGASVVGPVLGGEY